MKIGIIGAGQIGSTLTRRLTHLGHEVFVANSRGPETLSDLASETGANAVSLPETVRGMDLVIVTILAAGYFIATAALMPTAGNAHVDDKMPSMSAVRDDMVKASMSALRAKTGRLGEPKIEGKDPLAGNDAPALYFGATKMNNSSDVVDEVVKENGGAATLFVKAGDGYVCVATTVKKDDGSSALGTALDANNPAIAMINRGETYYGDATIFGKPYATGYEPIKDASGNVIGIYFVGYMK